MSTSSVGPAAPRTLPLVAILATPETTASVVLGLYDLFLSAGRDWAMVVGGEPGAALFEPVIVAVQAGTVVAGNRVPIHAHRSLADCPLPAIACVPELMLSPTAPIDGRFDAEVAWVLRCHASGAVLGTACSGALLLGEAGLLDDQDATTHWAFCDMLQARHPRARVRPRRALVVAGEGQRLVMAGGGSSWMDLGLYLIARLAGVEAALQVAKVNLIDWHAVGQQPFARVARTRQVEDAVIGRCQTWIADHYAEPSPVAAMAAHSGLPERSFQRRFKLATGMAPMAYVQTLRIEEAKQLLETGNASIEAIAEEVGYDDAAFFSRLFRRSVSLTPAQYRRRFGGMRAALTQ
ncbi:GlxA family transcriptional regulator [Variovorax sp. LT2P21]|uniref:GlxA family transcriptional regulator n=1 Tax=Variovorax sp. LT2P21 TaxID=3443731 RepID=UPI003F451CF2